MHIARTFVLLAALLAPASLFAAEPSLTVTQRSASHGSIPKGAQRVPFLTLTLEAACGADATVTELTVAHEGLGDSADIERVYVTEGRRRLTRSASIDASDRTALLRFRPALTIKGCGTRTINIAGDFASTAVAAGEHRLYVASPGGITTSAVVTLSGRIEERPSVVRPKSVGTVSVSFLKLLQPLRYGNGRTLARFRLEADGEANQEIYAITFTNAGKASDKDLQNLSVRNRRGKFLTNVATAMDGDRVRLTFDPPLRIDRNDEVLLELKGDVKASNRRTVRFTIEEPSDLEAASRAR